MLPHLRILPALALAAFLAGGAATPAARAETAAAATDPAAAARSASAVMARTFGTSVASRIRFESMPASASGLPVYEYEAKGGRLTVRGTSPVAMTRGAYDYIKASKLGMATRSGVRFDTAAAWPDTAPVRVESPFRFRHHYNVVSFGYQTPYYNRAAWERELDWLALHGYDLIMAPVATEAIAERAWKKIGLTQAELDDFSVGPAHLPWFRMGNIRNVDSPLPQEWHRDQLALQHFILGRMRELGMLPVVQSFAGFVPDAVKRLRPDIVLHDTRWNGGFGYDRRPRFITPDNALFAQMTKLYMDEWTKEFGYAKHWLVDSFNEMELPKTGRPPEDMLADYGRQIYGAISAAQPDAVWVIQGWMFNYQRHIWNKKTVPALLSAAPDDKLLVLDYANDYARNWDVFSAFHGKQWICGYVPNMGNKTAYTGRLEFYAKSAAETLASPQKGNLVGLTASGEGMDNNEVVYELIADTGWRRDAVKLDGWLNDYSVAKYGACPSEMTEAWQRFLKSCYSGLSAHPTFGWQHLRPGRGSVNRSEDFAEGAKKFLACAPKLKTSPLYRADALEVAALTLGGVAEDWYGLADASLDLGDTQAADRAIATAEKRLLQADRLLESHPLHRLARWTELARSHGDTPALKAYYESNARRIITSWGPPVNDYACKVWSGLIRDFYIPRMRARYEARKNGGRFDQNAWEAVWIKSTAGISPVTPYPDPVSSAVAAVNEALAEKVPAVGLGNTEKLDDWTPAMTPKNWTDIEVRLTAEQAKKLQGVLFEYTKGSHALEIRKVTLMADGRAVANDAHNGVAGAPASRNIYRLKLPAGATVNNGASLLISVRGHGGTDSTGAIRMLVK